MELKTFYAPGVSHFSYMVLSGGEALVIDPQRDIETYLETAAAWQAPITHILVTHTHADFAGGHLRLSRETAAPIIMSHKAKVDYPVEGKREGESLRVGGVEIGILETPGHTPDHISFVLTDHDAADTPLAIFTGDSLFSGDVGRPDLFGPEMQEELTRQLFETMEKYRAMGDGVLIYPAHGAGSLCGKRVGQRNPTSIGFERRANVMLQLDDFDAFKAELQSAMPTPPAYYYATAKKNARGEGLDRPFRAPKAVSAEQLAAFNGNVLDLRDQAGFAESHIPGSLNTVTDAHFSLLIGFAIDPSRPIALVGTADSVAHAAQTLYRMGYDGVDSYLAGEVDAWRNAARQTDAFDYLTALEADERVKAGTAVLVDIRTESEQADERIDGAIRLPLALMMERLDELPRDRQLIFQCGHGCRASLAASMLKREGIENVANLAGGILAWKAAGLPTETPETDTVDRAA